MARPTVEAKPLVDAATVLTAFLVLRLALPSQFIVPGLGGAGTPALLASVGLLVWWGWSWLNRTGRGWSSYVASAALVWSMALLVSYASAMLRPINATETSIATLALLGFLGWVGVMMVAHDGLDTRERWF
ncbi:MAG: hypothetical protein ACK5KO_04435, partial [Arachnia sp.]